MPACPASPPPRTRRVRLAVLSAAIAAAGLAVASAQAPTKHLRLVSTSWSPFTNVAGQPRFALDLVEAALGRIAITTTTTIVEPPQFTPSLLGDLFDGTAAAWRSAEREKVLLYSQPYLENRLILVGRRGSDVSAAALVHLTGKRIAIVGGYAYGDIDKSGPTFVRSKSDNDSLRLLVGKEVDYALMDELVVEYLVGQHAADARTKLAFGATPLVTRSLHLAVRRSLPDAQAIVDGFNAQIRKMIADRSYHKFLHVPWIRADVDGDGLEEYVPSSDQTSRTEPGRAYTLFASPTTETTGSLSASGATAGATSKPDGRSKRFYFGGNIYETWARVPEQYKGYTDDIPDPARSTASIFTFTW